MRQLNSNYQRGNVVLVLFPNSDLQTIKKRPALIVQADNLETGISQIIVAMITSNLSRANHPSRVQILLASPEGRQSGLQTNSVVMTDNLATIDQIAINRRLGTLPMAKIEESLRHTLNL